MYKSVIILLVSIGLSVLVTLLTNGRFQPVFLFVLLGTVTVWLFISVTGLLHAYTLKYFPRQQNSYTHLALLIPVTFLFSFGLLIVWRWLLFSVFDSGTTVNAGFLLSISVIVSILLVTFFEGITFFSYWKKYIIHSEQVEKANLLAQYETLRDQVNPHFLLNGLNTLISFIETNDKRAALFAQSMADFLKYLLTYHKEELIPLEKEISVVKQYVFLQQARFGENLVITINIDAVQLSSMLPPLTLQMLTENAIKHNTISAGKKLFVEITGQHGYVYVKNNSQPKADVVSTKVGINNIKGRYRLFTQQEVIIEETKQYFKIGVPLLNDKTYAYSDN